ncbi:MAG: dephospho-CoA kinase [Chlamydiales bacterium]|nr:dephospho-CoA kinase [Chlamydiales bacterium]
MLKCSKVAVTGSVSSGKSSVCRMLQDLGAHVVDADAIVHRLLTPGTEIGNTILALLGQDVLTNGQFDRSKIADKVFDNSALLRALEEILHPAVQQEIAAQYQHTDATNNAPLFVAEIPLLYEAGTQDFFDWVLVVSADETLSKDRFVKKTKYAEENYHKRLSRLMPLKEKERKADFVIFNNGSLTDLQNAVQSLFPELCRKRSSLEQE